MTTTSTEIHANIRCNVTSHEVVSDVNVDQLIAHSKNEIPVLTAEVLAGIDQLDELGSKKSNIFQAHEITSTINVFAGIKPASLILDFHVGNDKEKEKYKNIVSKLGLSLMQIPGKNYWIVSRHEEIAQELSQTLEEYHQGNHGDDITEHKIGKLLGYPQTATDYFIKRWHTMDTAEKLPVVEEELLGEDKPFVQMVLSPDNYEDELESYVRPLKRTVQALAPKSYEVIMDNYIASRRGSFGSKVLNKLGMKRT